MSPHKTSGSFKPALATLFVAIVAFLVSGLWFAKYRQDLGALKASFISEQKIIHQNQAKAIEEKFSYIYQAIRTMSFLPGVRNIDRYAKKFDENARASVQELYNNAFLNINLSEIYILPATLDPERNDAHTLQPEAPITTFDEFLTAKDNYKKPPEEKKDESTKLVEEESFEYRLMKTQLEDLRQQYPTLQSFEGLKVPLASGAPVITCDNAEFTAADLKNGNNFPREGIVFTVPRYDQRGNFAGGVSAVVRSKILQSYLDPGIHGLINRNHQVELIANPGSFWRQGSGFLRQGKQDPELIFSTATTLKTADMSPWELWTVVPNDAFWSSSRVTDASLVFYAGLSAILVIGTLLAIQVQKNHNNRRRIRDISVQLSGACEQLSRFSSDLMNDANRLSTSSQSLSAAVEIVAAAADEIRATTEHSAHNAQALVHSAEKSIRVVKSGKEAADDSLKVMLTLRAANEELATAVKQGAEKVGSLTSDMTSVRNKASLIDQIVFQTKLLSFNASVEAARAGAAGKGFAVVADEVGKLAKESGQSAQEIHGIIDVVSATSSAATKSLTENLDTQMQQVERQILAGTEQVDRCATAFTETEQAFADVNSFVRQLSQALEEQSTGVNKIAKNTSEFESGVRNSSAIASDTVRLSGLLDREAKELNKITAKLHDLMGGTKKMKRSA